MNGVKILRAIEFLLDAAPAGINLVGGVLKLIDARRKGEQVSDAELAEAIDAADVQVDRLAP